MSSPITWQQLNPFRYGDVDQTQYQNGGRGGDLSDSEHVMFIGTRWVSLIIAEPADIWVSSSF